jgi:FkbM family methyltransferase
MPFTAGLNRMIEPFGLRVEAMTAFERCFRRLLRTHGPFKFVQVGAHDGIQFDGLFRLVTAHRLPGLVLEPLADLFERLKANYAEYPEVVPVRCAVHPTEREAKVYRVDPTQLGRFETGTAGIASLQPEHHRRSGIPAEVMVTEVVPCRPLLEVVETYGFLDAAFLQIDAEGFDAEVIRMIDFKKFRPALIKFEQESLDGRDLVAIGSLLRNRGYRLRAEGPDVIAVHLA